MRTRRSPANQDRLFRELFKSRPPAPAPVKTYTCWDCRNYPKSQSLWFQGFIQTGPSTLLQYYPPLLLSQQQGIGV